METSCLRRPFRFEPPSKPSAGVSLPSGVGPRWRQPEPCPQLKLHFTLRAASLRLTLPAIDVWISGTPRNRLAPVRSAARPARIRRRTILATTMLLHLLTYALTVSAETLASAGRIDSWEPTGDPNRAENSSAHGAERDQREGW